MDLANQLSRSETLYFSFYHSVEFFCARREGLGGVRYSDARRGVGYLHLPFFAKSFMSKDKKIMTLIGSQDPGQRES